MQKGKNNHPKVSIGIPVYNGENYLSSALESILKQSFRDFEVVICDNASTDKTQEICEGFQSKDKRIRYYRNDFNLGAAANYKKAFQLAKGDLFKWMAHDDKCSPNYLEECVRILENDPDIVMSFPRVVPIDENDDPLPTVKDETYLTSTGRIISTNIQRNFMSERPSDRYSEVLFKTTECYEFFGLARRKIIERTSQHDAFYGSDKVLLCELSVMGKLREASSATSYFRIHGNQSQSLKDSKERAAWISPDLNYGAFMSRFKCIQGYFKCISAYPLSLKERLKCLWVFVAFSINLGNWKSLLRDIFGSKSTQISLSN